MTQEYYRKLVEKLAQIKKITQREAALIIIEAVKQFNKERGLSCH